VIEQALAAAVLCAQKQSQQSVEIPEDKDPRDFRDEVNRWLTASNVGAWVYWGPLRTTGQSRTRGRQVRGVELRLSYSEACADTPTSVAS
jgi:hypothetical protein